jgi:hypothetical protein
MANRYLPQFFLSFLMSFAGVRFSFDLIDRSPAIQIPRPVPAQNCLPPSADRPDLPCLSFEDIRNQIEKDPDVAEVETAVGDSLPQKENQMIRVNLVGERIEHVTSRIVPTHSLRLNLVASRKIQARGRILGVPVRGKSLYELIFR